MPTADQPSSRPIADHALLSDCHSSALVGSDGAIEWACLRRFDAPSTFARILDRERGGHFTIRPEGDVVERARRYLPGSMVLETTLSTASGTVVLTDAFAMCEGGARSPLGLLIRRVEVTEGHVEVSVVVEPRFDYGASHPWLRRHAGERVSAVAGPDALVLHATTELAVDQRAGRMRDPMPPGARMVPGSTPPRRRSIVRARRTDPAGTLP